MVQEVLLVPLGLNNIRTEHCVFIKGGLCGLETMVSKKFFELAAFTAF